MKSGDNNNNDRITRKAFLKKSLLTAGTAVVLAGCSEESSGLKLPIGNPDADGTKVYLVKNGTVQENIEKLMELTGGIETYIGAHDVVILKCNAQWPNQGYTNTECIKYVIDAILAIPDYDGEIIICDNIQSVANDETRGFSSSVANRTHNWSEHNWSTLAAEYQGDGYDVSVKQWINESLVDGTTLTDGIAGPADGTGWVRSFFTFHGMNVYLSYPIFESPLNSGRLIDPKNGVWESGGYTGRQVKVIMMPTLNNHGSGAEDYAGVTSAIKSFFGCSELHLYPDSTVLYNGNTYYHMHSTTYTGSHAFYAGELAARYIQDMYKPVLYITCAIWSGHDSRIGDATNTKTVIASTNPATLDYVSCKEVISPHASWLNPDNDNNTRQQILGCISGGIGTIDPAQYEVITYFFS